MPQPYRVRNPWEGVEAGYSFGQGVRQDVASSKAGNALASGNYQGASEALYQAGMLGQGAAVESHAASRAAAAKKASDQTRDDGLKFMASAAERLRRVYAMTPEPQRKERVLHAFDQIVPTFRQYGETDDELREARQQLETDPLGTLTLMGAGGGKKEFRTAGDEVFVLDEDGQMAARYRGAKTASVGDNGELYEVPGYYGADTPPGGPPAAGTPPAAATAAPAPTKAPTGAIYGQVAEIAAAAGARPDEATYLQRLAQVESNGDVNARNGSSTGIFQFQPDTFASVGGQNINDVGEQTKAALALSRRDRAALEAIGAPVTDANLYIMHQQGAGGGRALLTAPPEMNAVAALTPAYNGNAQRARLAIIRNAGAEDMTAGEFVSMWRDRWAGAKPGAPAPAAAPSAAPAPPGGPRLLVSRKRGPEWVDLPGGGQRNTRTNKTEGVPTGEDEALSEDSLDYVAQQYVATGQLPPLGTGKTGAANRAKVINRAAAIEKETGATGADAVERHLTIKAAGMALNQVSKQTAMISSFEKTAVKNADLALVLAKKGGAQGQIPVLNRWIQYGRKNVAGDSDVAAFDLALGTFADEYAKIVSGSMGNTALSDSAREEAYRRVNGAQTYEQLQKVIATMKLEMGNRMESLEDEKRTLRDTINSGGKSKDRHEGDAPPPRTEAAAPPSGAVAALKRDPRLAAQFDAKYGKGAAAKVLGGK